MSIQISASLKSYENVIVTGAVRISSVNFGKYCEVYDFMSRLQHIDDLPYKSHTKTTDSEVFLKAKTFDTRMGLSSGIKGSSAML